MTDHHRLYETLHVLLDELERRDADPTLLGDAMLAIGDSMTRSYGMTDRTLPALWASGWRPPSWDDNRGTASWSDVGLLWERMADRDGDPEAFDGHLMPCLRVRVEWQSRDVSIEERRTAGGAHGA